MHRQRLNQLFRQKYGLLEFKLLFRNRSKNLFLEKKKSELYWIFVESSNLQYLTAAQNQFLYNLGSDESLLTFRVLILYRVDIWREFWFRILRPVLGDVTKQAHEYFKQNRVNMKKHGELM